MNASLDPQQDRIAGGLLGLLVGDALGVPYEFHRAADLPPPEAIDYTPPPGFARSHARVPPGTWSDDGAQALCLLASLLECDGFDARDFAERLVRWYEEGYLAVDEVVFDVGVTTGRAIRALKAGVAPLEAGPSDAHDNGNGSLMRALPLALWHAGSDEDLVRDAHAQSRVTHGHLRSQVCCALYCLWARRTLAGSAAPWDDAVHALRSIYHASPDALEELEWSVRPDDPPEGKGSGYVVDCLRSARWACRAGSYADVVRKAILLGNDTDTTACVAGGIAGLRHGMSAIPDPWRAGLRGRDIYDPLLHRLLQCRTRGA
ncbi:ADP-ribosylglycohydrolase [Minicystis rosea]|nr:ADP-ribosylglycohydrolase [Minicystis rosea]